MPQGFWSQLHKPIFALAPLYDVTDAAFREIIAKYGKPDVMFTEFVSSDGLVSAGQQRLMHHLKYTESQRPIVAQIFGTNPENFAKAAQLAAQLKFDGIDINMGCPDKQIIKNGSCAGLFHQPKLAQEIIKACKISGLPVSVKIRIGDTKIDWREWIKHLLEAEPAAISIHLRTRKEMSKVDAHWEEMPAIMEFVREQAGDNRPLILGNGDVADLSDARAKAEQYGCDGVMLGRAIFGNPWLFTGRTEVSIGEKLRVCLEHAEAYEQLFPGIKPFEIMKKHFKAYISGWDGAKELRAQLMQTHSASEVEAILQPAIDATEKT